MHYDFFITGGNSPIGQYFLKELSKKYPNSRIASTSRTSIPIKSHVDFLEFDFKLSEEDLLNRQNFTCDNIIHLASCTPGNCHNGSLEEYVKVNVSAPYILFKKLFDTGASSLFYLSSTAVYNRSKGNRLNELSEKTCDDLYGLSKLLFEISAKDIAIEFKKPSLGLRVPVLLTDGIKHNFISGWKKKIHEKENITGSNPNAPFNAICPDWVLMSMFESFMDKQIRKSDNIHEVVNVFSDQPTTLGKVMDNIYPKKTTWVSNSQIPQTLESVSDLKMPSYCAEVELVKFFSS